MVLILQPGFMCVCQARGILGRQLRKSHALALRRLNCLRGGLHGPDRASDIPQQSIGCIGHSPWVAMYQRYDPNRTALVELP